MIYLYALASPRRGYLRSAVGSGTLLGDAQTNVNILPVDSDIPLRNLFKVAHDILR